MQEAMQWTCWRQSILNITLLYTLKVCWRCLGELDSTCLSQPILLILILSRLVMLGASCKLIGSSKLTCHFKSSYYFIIVNSLYMRCYIMVMLLWMSVDFKVLNIGLYRPWNKITSPNCTWSWLVYTSKHMYIYMYNWPVSKPIF